MKKRYLIFLALFITLTATAQSSSAKKIIAQITDNNDVPIPFATIALYANDYVIDGTVTDAYGFFEIEIAPGQRIVVSSLGFDNAKFDYGEVIDMDLIVLKTAIYELPTIIVTGITNPIKEHYCICGCTFKEDRIKKGNDPIEHSPIPDLVCYPNPTKDYVVVETETAQGFIHVLSSDGVLLKKIRITNDRQEIQLGDFPDGTYFITLQDPRAVKAIGKIIKSGQ